MPELKHTFVSGRMNKDFDERVLPNGEYRDALNIHVSTSEGSDANAVENILGNERVSSLNLINAKTIGSIAYSLTDKVYWFVTSDNIDGIYEYDQNQNIVVPILIDTKESKSSVLNAVNIEANDDDDLVLSNVIDSKLEAIFGNLPSANKKETLVKNNIDLSCADPYIKISVSKGTVIRKENDKYVFKNIAYNGQSYGNISITAVYSTNSLLNFSSENLITGINIIDSMLFWTDNLNPPRKINISKFKKFTNTPYPNTRGIFLTQTVVVYNTADANGNITKNYRAFTEADISVAKKAPLRAPTLELKDSLLNGKTEINSDINFYTSNTIAGGGDKFIGVGEDLTISNIDELLLPAAERLTWKIGDNVLFTDADREFEIEATVKNILNNTVTVKILNFSAIPENETITYTISLIEKDPIYELDFVRFAYRWKYKDGEYSTLSPFSEAAFIPGKFFYDGKNAFNEGMENTLQKIILSNFNVGDSNVEKIEILFKETGNQNIYAVEEIKTLGFQNKYEITKKQIHSILPNDQLLRAWDNVPKRAKAQEITANRIIYGNYTQNYDVYNSPEFDISIVNREDNRKNSIKSNRTYQVGVVYMDEFNRHTPILSSQSGSFTVNKDQATARNQFNISLKNDPPAWATHFKYYIKDPKAEYYNLAADKFYFDDTSGFTYVSMPSGERNKITAESYLFLKKKHGENTASSFKNNRYKVIDIFNEAPDFVAERKEQISKLSNIEFANDFLSSAGQQNSLLTNFTPTKEAISFVIYIANGGNTEDNKGIPESDKENLLPGKYIKFQTNTAESVNSYEIRSVEYIAGKHFAKITVKNPFEEIDVNFLYDNSNQLVDNIGINILELKNKKGAKEFDGRFFIKIKTNSTLKDAAFNTDPVDDNYFSFETIRLNGIPYQETFKNNGALGNANRRGNPDNQKRFTKDNLVFVSKGGNGIRYKVDNSTFDIRIEEVFSLQDESIIKKFKTGELLRFSTHDTIYKIKSIKENVKILPGKTTSRKAQKRRITYRDLELETIDSEPLQGLQNTVVKEGDNIGPNLVECNFLKIINDDEIIFENDPAIFETEPVESETELDIYYETERAISIAEHGNSHKLKWYNAFSFGNGVESNRIRDDFNAPYLKTGVRASAPLLEEIREESKFNGIIWSGIVNSRSGINKSNEFNVANPITKDLLPLYGSIQKLFARDSDLVILCEDKIVKAYADKDALYNADGSFNLVATNRVIGDVKPYAGEYGISKNPESFAFHDFRAYFTDKMRGAVLRLSLDGLTVISKYGMNDFFKDRFFDTGCYNSTVNNNLLIGSYDNYNELYNITFQDKDTVCFAENAAGWPTRKSFVPQYGISLNKKYYTFSNGELYDNNSENVPRNNFYNNQYTSKVELEINDDPSVIKKYKTLGYEGSKGWTADIITDQQKSSNISFINKENKYFANVNGELKTVDNLNTKNFSFQGIGESDTVSSVASVSNTTLTFALSPSSTESYVSNNVVLTQSPGKKLSTTVDIILRAKNDYILDANKFNLKNVNAIQEGDDIKLVYTHGQKIQPTSDKTITLELCKVDFTSKKDITVSGTYNFSGTNVSITKETANYSFSGNANVLKTIVTRTITPNTGYKLTKEDITVDNPSILITKQVNPNGSITIIEQLIIGRNNETNKDYTVSVNLGSTSKLAPSKRKLLYYELDTTDLKAPAEDRLFTVFSEGGANISYVLKDPNGNEIKKETDVTISNTGIFKTNLQFPSGTSDETFTLEIFTDDTTEFGTSFGSTNININRHIPVSKSLKFVSYFDTTSSNVTELKVFEGEDGQMSFISEVATTAGTTYTVKRQPTQGDINFDKVVNNITFSNLNLEYVALSNVLRVTGDISIIDAAEDVYSTLDITKVAGADITVTVDYSKTTTTNVVTANYTVTDPSTNTIDGPSGNPPTSIENDYIFTLEPSSGYQFIDNITNTDFVLVDSSNNSVLDIYSNNNNIKLSIDQNKIKVGFVSGIFNMPSANTTITIRPTKAIAETTSVNPDFRVIANKGDQLVEYQVDKKIKGPLTTSSGQNLFSFVFTIKDDHLQAIFKELDSDHSFSLDGVLSLAAAGTYNDFNGDSKTITDDIVLSDDRKTLTVNILANISSNPGLKVANFSHTLQIEEVSKDIELDFIGPGTNQACFNSSTPISERNRRQGLLIQKDINKNEPAIGDEISEYNNISRGFTSLIDPTITFASYQLVDQNYVIVVKQSENGDKRDEIINILPCEEDKDGDRIADNIDPDDDNDGTEDVLDLFPNDPDEDSDEDGDGIGDNEDTDDDGDGVEDILQDQSYTIYIVDNINNGSVTSPSVLNIVRDTGQTYPFTITTKVDDGFENFTVSSTLQPSNAPISITKSGTTFNSVLTMPYGGGSATIYIGGDATALPKDTDGDGIADNVDIDPNDPNVSTASQFVFDSDVYSNDNCAELRSGKRLYAFSREAGSGWVIPEIQRIPAGINLSDVTWKASASASWIIITNTSGQAVEKEAHDQGQNVINGDRINFTVPELPEGADDREGLVYADFYYKNSFLKRTSTRIKQDDINCDITADGLEIPADATPDQPNLPCSTVVRTHRGGQGDFQKLEFNLGSSTGTVPVYFNPQGLPDRMIIVNNGKIVLDTGYVTWFGDGYKQAQIDAVLSAKGLNLLPVKSVYTATGNTRAARGTTSIIDTIYGYTWEKTSTASATQVYIYAPLPGTEWEMAMNCPGEDLVLTFFAGGGGG